MRLPVSIPRLALMLALSLCGSMGHAQPDFLIHAAPVAPAAPDPAIASALQAIQPAHIEETIKTLVGFGTRSTLSSMETDLPPGQGINAAADWVAGQFEQISHECGGCLEVHRDTFTEPAGTEPGTRIPQPITITNVYAILRGADPVQ